MPRWVWVLLVLALGGWWLSSGEPAAVVHGPGVLVGEEPLQGPVEGAPPERLGAFRVQALHSFSVRGRVLGREDYRFGTEAELSPMDLALGWGRMSDTAVLERLSIGQGGRFYHYRWGGDGPPIPVGEIVRSSANMHMVPLDAGVAAQLERVAEGQVVRLEGWLVRVERADGWHWVSSTRRDDSGAGACELVLVVAVQVEPQA